MTYEDYLLNGGTPIEEEECALVTYEDHLLNGGTPIVEEEEDQQERRTGGRDCSRTRACVRRR